MENFFVFPGTALDPISRAPNFSRNLTLRSFSVIFYFLISLHVSVFFVLRFRVCSSSSLKGRLWSVFSRTQFSFVCFVEISFPPLSWYLILCYFSTVWRYSSLIYLTDLVMHKINLLLLQIHSPVARVEIYIVRITVFCVSWYSSHSSCLVTILSSQ